MLELATLIKRHARLRPDAVAVAFEGTRYTYREFWERVARAGNLLRCLGVRPGDKLATVAANSLELLEIYWAVPSIGAALVPLSPLLLREGLATRAELTRERFVANPFAMTPEDRVLYRTGDWVQWRDDGVLEYRGRRDSQVKIRGQRVEIGEIEHALHHHPAIQQVAVIVDDRKAERLTAIIVPRNEVTPAELHEFLAQRLPASMMPASYCLSLIHI